MLSLGSGTLVIVVARMPEVVDLAFFAPEVMVLDLDLGNSFGAEKILL